MQCPDHGDWECEDDEITNKGKHTVGQADYDQSVGDAVAWLCLVPEVGDGGALEDVRGKGCYCPAL